MRTLVLLPMSPVQLSVVVPVYNEELNLPELYQRLTKTLAPNFASYEIIFVDDCSRDGSWKMIADLAKQDTHVRGMRFSRNSGEHIAVSAGLDEARGEFVALTDGDLQDPPEAFPELFSTLQQGYDLVYAIRRNRQHRFLKRWTSSLFWKFLRVSTGLDIPRDQATQRIMTRRFRDALCALPERNRFVYGLSAVLGFPQKGVEVEHGKRMHGRSSYNVGRLLHLAVTAIVSLSTFPLKLAFYLGFLCSFLSIVFAVFIVVQRLFFDISMEGWASMMTAIFFMGGAQMMMTGIVGLYVGRTYIETKQRPLYFLSDRTDHGITA